MGSREEDTEADLPENDGLRPDEHAGPGACEADVRRTENLVGDRVGGVEQSDFQSSDELHEQFPVEEIPIGTDPVDGMPVPITGDIQAAQAPPFTYETVVCIEDDRQYVELFYEELRERGWRMAVAGVDAVSEGWFPPDVRRIWASNIEADLPICLDLQSRFETDGSDRNRRVFEPDLVERIWGVSVVMSDDGNGFVPVRPVRERCEYYKRQVFSNDDQPNPKTEGHQIVFRNCTARRSNGGAFMSLRDESVYSCDYREPPDAPTVEEQDKKDRSKLVSRPDLLRLPLFHLDGEAVRIEKKP